MPYTLVYLSYATQDGSIFNCSVSFRTLRVLDKFQSGKYQTDVPLQFTLNQLNLTMPIHLGILKPFLE